MVLFVDAVFLQFLRASSVLLTTIPIDGVQSFIIVFSLLLNRRKKAKNLRRNQKKR